MGRVRNSWGAVVPHRRLSNEAMDTLEREGHDGLYRNAREVVTAHLDRIAAVNPVVNAIVTLTAERALERAAQQDDIAAGGTFVGPLHGIPVAHKDNHLTAGIRTTFGSQARADFIPDTDDLVIERMKAAGVISRENEHSRVRRRWAHFQRRLRRHAQPLRSSRSRPAVRRVAPPALAAGMHPIADGNDLGGSLRLPAGYCNCHRVAAVGRQGARLPRRRRPSRPVGPGPMARTVDDLALLLSVMAGPDRRSPLSLEEPGEAVCAGGSRIAGRPADRVLTRPRRSDRGRGRGSRNRLGGGGDLETHGRWSNRRVPGFTGADECFRILRAWTFEATLERLTSTRSSVPACTQTCWRAMNSPGRTSDGPRCCEPCCSTGCAPSWSVRRTAATGRPATGISHRSAVPHLGGRCRTARLPGLDANGHLSDGHRTSGDLHAGRVQLCRDSAGGADRRPAPGRAGAAVDRQGFRERHWFRRTPPRAGLSRTGRTLLGCDNPHRS